MPAYGTLPVNSKYQRPDFGVGPASGQMYNRQEVMDALNRNKLDLSGPTSPYTDQRFDSLYNEGMNSYKPKPNTGVGRSTFGGKLGLAPPTVANPYNPGQQMYDWQGVPAAYGRTRYNTAIHDPVTGHTTNESWATGGGVPQAPMYPQAQAGGQMSQPVSITANYRGLQNPFTGDIIQRNKGAAYNYGDPIRLAEAYNQSIKGTDAPPLTLGMGGKVTDHAGNVVDPQRLQSMLLQRQYRQGMDANKDAWGRISANKQAQNAGYNNVLDMAIARDMIGGGGLVAGRRGVLGRGGVVGFGGGGGGGDPMEGVLGGQAPAQAGAAGQPAAPLSPANVMPGGLNESAYANIKQQMAAGVKPSAIKWPGNMTMAQKNLVINSLNPNLHTGGELGWGQSIDPYGNLRSSFLRDSVSGMIGPNWFRPDTPDTSMIPPLQNATVRQGASAFPEGMHAVEQAGENPTTTAQRNQILANMGQARAEAEMARRRKAGQLKSGGSWDNLLRNLGMIGDEGD